MTIIDLLNKKANGEETPKKFKYDDLIFEENKYGFYIDNKESNLIDSIYYDYSNLNDEIEIIEDTPKEDKKIEKFYFSLYQYDKLGGTEIVGNLESKINEIIEHINEGENK